MDVMQLIDRAKSEAGISTDSGLAERLGVTKQAVSNWRHGTKLPDPVACEKLAVLSGFPLNQVIGVVGEARAISTAEKRVWRKLAAAIFVSLCVTLPVQAATEFPTNGHGESASDLYIMRNLRRITRRGWHAIRKAVASLNNRPGGLDETSPVLA